MNSIDRSLSIAKKVLLVLTSFIMIIGCSVKQKPIEYGVDNCAFCDMTIVDNKHSAELVTIKGKAFAFDAIECMLRYKHRSEEQGYSLLLIADYLNPGYLINAETSIYLISRNIPSPMGSYLSGFKSAYDAETILNSNGGDLYTWEEISLFINSK